MSGRRGRSGNSPNVDGMSIYDIVNRSISLCYRFINDEKQPLEKRADVASRFVLKRMADKIEVEVNHQLNSEQMKLLYAKVDSLVQPTYIAENSATQ